MVMIEMIALFPFPRCLNFYGPRFVFQEYCDRNLRQDWETYAIPDVDSELYGIRDLEYYEVATGKVPSTIMSKQISPHTYPNFDNSQ